VPSVPLPSLRVRSDGTWILCRDSAERVHRFHRFRRRVEDALLNCCVCLGADALSQLCTVLAAAGAQWQVVEGLLFSVAAIGLELVTLSDAAQRGRVLSCVGELLSGYIFAKKLPDHVLVSSAALLVVASYAKCVGQSAPLVPQEDCPSRLPCVTMK